MSNLHSICVRATFVHSNYYRLKSHKASSKWICRVRALWPPRAFVGARHMLKAKPKVHCRPWWCAVAHLRMSNALDLPLQSECEAIVTINHSVNYAYHVECGWLWVTHLQFKCTVDGGALTHLLHEQNQKKHIYPNNFGLWLRQFMRIFNGKGKWNMRATDEIFNSGWAWERKKILLSTPLDLHDPSRMTIAIKNHCWEHQDIHVQNGSNSVIGHRWVELRRQAKMLLMDVIP